MIKSVEHGWLNIEINGYTIKASYVKDSINDLLKAIILAMKTGVSTTVVFDAEEYRDILIISDTDLLVLTNNDSDTDDFYFKEVSYIDIKIEQFAKEIRDDILANYTRCLDLTSDVHIFMVFMRELGDLLKE